MNTKKHAQSGSLDLRALILLLLCAVPSSVLVGTLMGFFRPETQGSVSQRTLTFDERVAYQTAIEDVYWRHRIWPRSGGERPDPKPSLDAIMSRAQLEKNVTDYIRNSQALEDYWQQPLTAEQLQAEMDRMAQHTKQPEVLRELFAALGNDPFVIAECLARPVLSERMGANFYADDKEPSDFSQARPENQMPTLMAAASANYTLPTISDAPNGCIDDWEATTISNAPPGGDHTAVWTGSEMIVWGGIGTRVDLNTGRRYHPSTDSWRRTSTTNAPGTPREGHTAVWTGSEMIVWGGYSYPNHLNTGGRYNPTTNSWIATNTTNAPSSRSSHTAVWTGSEMIVWGGGDNINVFNTGGRYNPSTDSWAATSITNAPTERAGHTAVWTGSEMIVWGGLGAAPHLFGAGGRYNPSRNSWRAVSTTKAPSPRIGHTAVWTGSEMIVWGGRLFDRLNTGGRYCAQSGSPTPTPTATVTPTPAVTTNPATKVASFSATLNGSLNPRGSTTTVYFQYGLTTSYGSNTPMQTQTGNTVRAISANISGLAASHVYHFRIVAHNAGGTAYGSDRTFTTLSATGPPVVITNPATFIASYSAKLNGSVDPHGLTTTVYFQYGTTNSYGSTTANQTKTGNTYQNVAANISGLSASTTYHFRIVATNSAGTVYGSDRTFTTLSAIGPPVVITNPATNVASSSATLNGSVDPHGLSTTVYFQYGRTTGYGSTTPNQTKTGNTYQNVAANISGLTASTTYHFRIAATNTGGTRYGSDWTFTTP